MAVVFEDKSDIPIFFSLVIMIFTSVFLGTIQSINYKNNREWYLSISKKIPGMAPSILFPVIWTILYILMSIGLFMFYRNIPFPNTGYVIDTITFLTVFNLMANKMWTYVFFHLKRTILSLIMIIFIFITALIMDVLFGIYTQYISMGCFIPYIIWCLYAIYLNAMWIYVEKCNRLVTKGANVINLYSHV